MAQIRKFEYAIFDLDGTLLDSLGVWAELDGKFLARRGLIATPDYTRAVQSMNFREAALYTIERYSLPDPPETLEREWKEMIREAYATEILLKPYAGEYLQKLAHEGVKLALATSSAEELFEPALKRNGVFELFSAFSTTGKTRGKRFPDVYLDAAAKLGALPKQCAVFEDVPAALQTAKDAGFYAVAVEDDYSKHEDLLRDICDFYVNTFKELL